MPTPAPVSLHLIVLDEPLIEKSLRDIRPYVAEIVVVDTGSAPEWVAKYNAMAEEGIIDTFVAVKPDTFVYKGVGFDFGAARNYALSFCTQPFIMWMDGDDEIDGIEFLSDVLAGPVGDSIADRPDRMVEVLCPYEYEYNEAGEPTTTFYRERILQVPAGAKATEAWRWSAPIHETIIPVGMQSQRLLSGKLIWKHRRRALGKNGDRALARNMVLLRAQREHEGKSHRNSFYLALTLEQQDRSALSVEKQTEILNEAISLYQEASALAVLDEECFITAIKLTDALHVVGRHREAIPWAHLAMGLQETWSEGYFAVSRAYYFVASAEKSIRYWERCVHFGELGLAQPQWGPKAQPVLFLIDAVHREAAHHRFMAVAYDNLSMYDKALASAQIVFETWPSDRGAIFSKNVLEVADARKKVADAANVLARHTQTRDPLIRQQIKWALQAMTEVALPMGVDASAIRPVPAALREDGRLRVMFVLGRPASGIRYAPWDPDTLKGPGRGGGSETAVVEMASRLHQAGCVVEVYGPCGEWGDFDGVLWAPLQALKSDTVADVSIAWRQGDCLPLGNARLRVLWLHDTVAHAATPDNLLWADLALTLSTWHREHIVKAYPSLRKVVQTRTAISRIERFYRKDIPREPGRAIWTMSPDRGLENLLDMWPQIREVVPHAHLHVFYGFDGWRIRQLHEANRVERRTRATPGVTLYERVSPDELAIEYLKSSAWLYPNDCFAESGPVSPMEAQVAGCRVVSTDLTALAENVRIGKKISLDIGWKTDFLYAAIDALNAPPPEAGGLEINDFSYEGLAEAWIALFREEMGL
jgi:glycosyltransferase involved in cell wall biosynthesis